MFIRLGIQNVWRNLGRSVLAIVSMALAAAFFTYVISIGRGYTQQAGQPLRNMLGGEIIVYSEKTTAEKPNEDSIWEYYRGRLDPFTDLSYLFPDMASTGYMREVMNQNGFSQEDKKNFLGENAIIDVQPLYRLPAETIAYVDPYSVTEPLPPKLISKQDDGSILGPEISYASALQGRNWQINQRYSMENSITSGRWFEESDEGKFVGIISANQILPQWVNFPIPGELITIEIPAFQWVDDAWKADYANVYRFEIAIIGNLSLIDWYPDKYGNLEPVDVFFSEVYIPQETFNQIWAQVSNGGEYKPSELLLQVADLTYLQDIVFDLQEKYSQFSYIDLPQQMERVHNNTSLVPLLSNELLTVLQDMTGTLKNQGVLSTDLRLPITILILINAALLVAANILILVSERRKEIAVLKALGSKGCEIILMILSEAMLISGIGAVLGFLFIRIQAFLSQLTNPSGILQILGSFVLDWIIVITVILLLAIIFGFIPAKKYSSLPVMAVLRND